MQDPSETKHAKNTARLIPLLLPQAEIFVGEYPQDFHALQEKNRRFPKTLLLYPTSSAREYSEKQATTLTIEHIILLDGTWRKTKRLYLNNPWLKLLDSASLAVATPSFYDIRRRPFAHSYSTIEAIAHGLAALENCPTAPFFQLLNALQNHWHIHNLAHRK